jgi:hypothetical protein
MGSAEEFVMPGRFGGLQLSRETQSPPCGVNWLKAAMQ